MIEFKISVPVDDAGLVSQVQHALSLDLPELRDFEYPWPETLRIVANGPTARHAPLDGKTLALNGALQLFTDRGLEPTYWAACDPAEVVAGFIPDDPPQSTVYLVASKCHPKVFERLSGRKVIMWHVDDLATWALLEDRNCVRSACSITLTSLELMARLGFRSFETWGLDGCFIDGLDHASPQPTGGAHITVDVGSRSFATTTNWALEAQNAVQVFSRFPFTVEIKGDGMIGAVVAEMLGEPKAQAAVADAH